MVSLRYDSLGLVNPSLLLCAKCKLQFTRSVLNVTWSITDILVRRSTQCFTSPIELKLYQDQMPPFPDVAFAISYKAFSLSTQVCAFIQLNVCVYVCLDKCLDGSNRHIIPHGQFFIWSLSGCTNRDFLFPCKSSLRFTMTIRRLRREALIKKIVAYDFTCRFHVI